MNLSAPKFLNHNYIEEYLKTIEIVFQLPGKMIRDVNMNLSNVQETSIVGLLLVYKIVDFTYQNNCFFKPNLTTNKLIEDAWDKYDFRDLMNRYINKKDLTEEAYKNFKIKIENNFIIAPQPLLRSAEFSKESLKNEFIPKLNSYYKDEKLVSMLFTCLSELLLNFWEHAKEDNRSIIIADGTKNKIEIACADTGDGMLTTLKQNPKYSNYSSIQLIEKSVSKGATSKEYTNHMGYGLWIIDQLTTLTKGKFHIYSEGVFYQNNFGKKIKKKCSYWKGTIVYLNLPLSKAYTLCDLEPLLISEKSNQIKINFI